MMHSCVTLKQGEIQLPLYGAYVFCLIIIIVLQPPDKAVQGVNHCLIKPLPFNQLPCKQVSSSCQSAGVLETVNAGNRRFWVLVCCFKQEMLILKWDTLTASMLKCKLKCLHTHLKWWLYTIFHHGSPRFYLILFMKCTDQTYYQTYNNAFFTVLNDAHGRQDIIPIYATMKIIKPPHCFLILFDSLWNIRIE